MNITVEGGVVIKVLMLTSSYPTEQNPACGTYVQNLAHGLAALGVNITVLMFSSDGRLSVHNDNDNSAIKVIEYPYSLFLPPSLHKHSGLVPTIKKSNYAKLELPLYSLSTLYHLRKQLRDSDIIHAHWLVPSGFLASVNRMFCDLPLIATAHGADLHLHNNYLTRSALNFVGKKSDLMVAVSRYVASRAGEYGIDMSKMDIIPNGVDIQKFKPTGRKDDDAVVIGTIRRLVPEKRIEDLILAVHIIPEDIRRGIRLMIVGDGPEMPKLKALTTRLRLCSITEFFGTVPCLDVPKLLQKMDIFVNPSVQEGMSTSNLEAMASGVPTVACNGYGNDEVIANGKTGFLYPSRDRLALAGILTELIENESMRVDVGKRGREHVEKKFTIEKAAEMYLDRYKSL